LNDNNIPSDDNTAIINNFSFGGGAATGSPTYYCTTFPTGGSGAGVSGDLTAGITLQDKAR
jgi:hypothetical protein